ncbi:TRAP transporter small permease subunit [Ancylobacter dichloromethanicus]
MPLCSCFASATPMWRESTSASTCSIPASGRRPLQPSSSIGAAFFLVPFCVAVLYYGWGFVAHSFRLDEGSPSLTGLPHRWIIKSALVIGFTTLLLSALGAITGALATLLGAAPPRGHHDAHQEVGL